MPLTFPLGKVNEFLLTRMLQGVILRNESLDTSDSMCVKKILLKGDKIYINFNAFFFSV